MSSSFDIIVVGGGIVGIAAALRFSSLGYEVCVLDEALSSSPLKLGELGPDIRTVALSLRSVDFLKELGAFSGVEPTWLKRMEVYTLTKRSALYFDASELCGHSVAAVFEHAPLLSDFMRVLEGSRVCTKMASCTGYEQEVGKSRILCSDGSSLSASWVVAADGAQSPLRDFLGVNATYVGGSSRVFASIVKTKQNLKHLAWQAFLPEGVLALLSLMPRGLGDDYAYFSLIFSVRSTCIGDMLSYEKAQWQNFFSNHLPFEVCQIDKVISFPVRQSVADTFCVDHRSFFVGDAGRVIHPLAGQGLNLGLEDVQQLSVTFEKMQKNPNLSSWYFDQWSRQRRIKSRVVASLLEEIWSFYESDILAPSLKDFIITRLNRTPLLKNMCYLEAGGTLTDY